MTQGRQRPNYRRMSLREIEVSVRTAVDAGDIDRVGEVLLDDKEPLHVRTIVAAQLGTADDASAAASWLRAVLRRPVPHTDIWCASMVALGRLAGPDCSSDLAPFLDSKSSPTRMYAFHVIGKLGNISLLPRILEEWTKAYKASRGRQPASVPDVARFLGRHLGDIDVETRKTVLDYGVRIYERAHPGIQRWFDWYWPAIRETDGDRAPTHWLLNEPLRPRPDELPPESLFAP